MSQRHRPEAASESCKTSYLDFCQYSLDNTRDSPQNVSISVQSQEYEYLSVSRPFVVLVPVGTRKFHGIQ